MRFPVPKKIILDSKIKTNNVAQHAYQQSTFFQSNSMQQMPFASNVVHPNFTSPISQPNINILSNVSQPSTTNQAHFPFYLPAPMPFQQPPMLSMLGHSFMKDNPQSQEYLKYFERDYFNLLHSLGYTLKIPNEQSHEGHNTPRSISN